MWVAVVNRSAIPSSVGTIISAVPCSGGSAERTASTSSSAPARMWPSRLRALRHAAIASTASTAPSSSAPRNGGRNGWVMASTGSAMTSRIAISSVTTSARRGASARSTTPVLGSAVRARTIAMPRAVRPIPIPNGVATASATTPSTIAVTSGAMRVASACASAG